MIQWNAKCNLVYKQKKTNKINIVQLLDRY